VINVGASASRSQSLLRESSIHSGCLLSTLSCRDTLARFRASWIQRINAAVRAEGLTYGTFMHGLKLAGVDLDRKVLADIAMHEGEAFKGIIALARGALPAQA
jgi:ribosomal protein L20